MPDYIVLNTAAINNLLDGHIPRYAVVSANPNGFRISPFKIQRGNALPVTKNGFEIPEDLDESPQGGQNYAVRIDDADHIIVYEVNGTRSNMMPSAKIVNREAIKIPSYTPETIKRTTPANDIDIVVEKPKSFLIRGADLDARRPEPISTPEANTDDELDTMATRLLNGWTKPSEPSHTLHFAVEEENFTQGRKREIDKIIRVPVSFDKRRGMGTRAVEVRIKRRRAFG